MERNSTTDGWDTSGGKDFWFEKSEKNLKAGNYPRFGFGGAVFQWHPELKIGFGYCPNLVAWDDPVNSRGARLQEEVVNCVRKRNVKAKM